ncbi:unnamed protein product [Linum tenue]|uniref:Uncharacterized protein n=1 Tax=Linum tenue TaxID=586396 RepID=A0AAV0LS55_9ROSI|nr:unnamed protein product [Linum tenue]
MRQSVQPQIGRVSYELIFDTYPSHVVGWHVRQFPLHRQQWCTRVSYCVVARARSMLTTICREQCLPLEPLESHKSFHGKDGRQGTRDELIKLRDFIDRWNNRQDEDIATTRAAEPMGYHDPYMDQYRKQSVRCITLKMEQRRGPHDGLPY